MHRNLDGVYFRVKREDKWDNVCFSDLTEEEQKQVLENKDIEWVKSLAYSLAKTIQFIGNAFDLHAE